MITLTFYRSVHATCQRQIQKERQGKLDFIASSKHKQAPTLTEIATNPTPNKLHTDTHHGMFQQNWSRCRQKIHSGKHWQNPTLHQTRRQILHFIKLADRLMCTWKLRKKEQFSIETKKAAVPGCGAVCYSGRPMLWNVWHFLGPAR